MTPLPRWPATPTSANSTLLFAEGLRTPSPTDDEAEAIWESARNAGPLFPDLHLGQPGSSDAESSEHRSIYRLDPGEKGVVKDTRDVAGNRQSVLLVYEADDESASPTPVAENYDDCVVDLSLPPTTERPQPPAANAKPSKEKGRVLKFKKAFKLAAPSKGKAPIPVPQNNGKASPSLQQRRGLPAIRTVQLPTNGNSQPKLAEPVPKKTVGHPDRMTRWGDFSQYAPEPAAEPSHESSEGKPRRKRTPDLNKPLPNLPPPGSHLRMTRVPETMVTAPDSPPPVPEIPSAYRKSKNRRTAVYAGSIFSSDEEVIDTYSSSGFGTPVATQTPPTSEDEQGDDNDSTERLELLDRLQKLSVSNNGMHTGFDRPYDPDDEDYKSLDVDTFVHDRHTSFLITERLDENTIRSMYGTEDRRDGESPTDIWHKLRGQVGGGSWGGD